jgi:hypothetical protein
MYKELDKCYRIEEWAKEWAKYGTHGTLYSNKLVQVVVPDKCCEI